MATVKAGGYEGHKLLLVSPEAPDGGLSERAYIAVDFVQAGPGDRVLLLREGSSVRELLGRETAPVHAAIVGFVDEVTR